MESPEGPYPIIHLVRKVCSVITSRNGIEELITLGILIQLRNPSPPME